MSNIESLLTAILTRDAQYIVVPQSRVEELLLAIYNSGGGGGGGEGGVDEFARAELLKKVDKRDGYALISTSEIERLAGISNYDDTAIKASIDKKVTAKNGFSLIDDTDYANFKNLKNYDDTAIKALINKKVDDTVTVAGLKITTNITAAQLATALELSTYVKKDGTKVLSTNDFTNDYKNQIDTNTTEIEKKVNKTSVSSANKTTSTIAITDNSQMVMVAKISGKTVKDGTTLKSAAVESVVSRDSNGNVKTTVLVPQSIIDKCPDYGVEGNILDLENGVYYHNYTKKKIKDLTWDYQAASSVLSAYVTTGKSKGNNYNIIIPEYTGTSITDASSMPNKSIRFGSAGDSLYVKDSSYTSGGAFTAAKGELEFVYELVDSEKKTIPLTDYIRPLPVEAGGTLTLVNEHNLDMPSVIKYKKEV